MVKTLEDIFIGNLLVGEKLVWQIMDMENYQYLGESWNTTADKLAMDGDLIIFNSLPQELKEWTEYQTDNQTDIYLSIQAIHTSIHSLGQYLIIKNIINTRDWTEHQKLNLSNYIGWVWHFLHMEP